MIKFETPWNNDMIIQGLRYIIDNGSPKQKKEIRDALLAVIRKNPSVLDGSDLDENYKDYILRKAGL